MRARLVVFPLRGRNWCFSRSIDPSIAEATSDHNPSNFKELWKKISSSKSSANNAELLIDFISNKMNKAWTGLEMAPEGTMKNKIHGLGLKLLARVKPSEIFLKSISKEVSGVDITYPSSLNARLVRRRLRHIAIRGAAIHKRYFYGSVALVPLTSALSILPLPNIAFFWVLFRTYSHWRALQGSEKLLQIVSDFSNAGNSDSQNMKEIEAESDDAKHMIHKSRCSLLVLYPSKKLGELLCCIDEEDVLDKRAILNICKTYKLNTNDVLKFRNAM